MPNIFFIKYEMFGTRIEEYSLAFVLFSPKMEEFQHEIVGFL